VFILPLLKSERRSDVISEVAFSQLINNKIGLDFSYKSEVKLPTIVMGINGVSESFI